MKAARASSLLALVAACGALLLSGCQTAAYYSQAIRGQLSLLQQRQPLARLLDDPTLPAARRQQLALVQRVRDFAATELGLSFAGQFDSYVELDRDFVVWNVVAAPEFSLEPRRWCFPVAGCVSYRGYFAAGAAETYAGTLATEGWDTYVGGVTAYSTLGWFDDPVLSSMLRRDDIQLVAVLIHELAHAQLYVAGDTEFNESFATTVELEGVRRWLATEVAGEARESQSQAAEVARLRQQEFVELVQRAASDLDVLYKEGGEMASLRQRKQARQQQLRDDYQQLKASWGGYAGYDRWFEGPLNNAQLGTVRTYHSLVPALQNLLTREGGDLTAFYRSAAALGSLSAAERQARLSAL